MRYIAREVVPTCSPWRPAMPPARLRRLSSNSRDTPRGATVAWWQTLLGSTAMSGPPR